MKYSQKFRLNGVPQSIAQKLIEIDPDQKVSEIKSQIRNNFNLDSVLAIQFIHKGLVLNDMDAFSKYAIHPKRDVVAIMTTQAGG